MTRTGRRIYLSVFAVLMALLLAGFLFDEESSRGAARPDDIETLAAWIRNHPADWVAANAIADVALDAPLPRRFELWRAAYAHASSLAPRRPHPRSSFVRGGLFHWYELPRNDRAAVLEAAAPLLKDPRTFAAMHGPLWELTSDFDYLRRNAPDTERALIWLRDTAATHGLFDRYRELREAIDGARLRAFEQNRPKLAPPEMVMLLPPRLTLNDALLVRRVLEELRRRPLDAGNAASVRNRADELVAFAIHQEIRPLDGLEALVDTHAIHAATRARLALALGRETAATNIELAGSSPSEEWRAYYLERSAFETGRGDAAMAELYRRRAASIETGGQWRGTCGRNEVCKSATASMHVARAGDPLVVHVQNAQSDEIPPYVEIYAGDARVAEGPVTDARSFRVAAPEAGTNRVEVRLINPWTRNRIQRRVRLS